jgi:LysR family transcriptional activator of nhaA
MATWLNHHHLQYFRLIAREGGISPAARQLGLTHSTLSAQLKTLEGVLGAPLFDRKGGRLVLTPFGEQALTYAESIHRLGAELLDVAEGRAAPAQRRPFRVACLASLPRTVVMQLLEPALRTGSVAPLEIRQVDQATMVGELVAGRTHLALSDAPAVRPGVHAHLLGSSGITWYAARRLVRERRRQRLLGLERASFILPTSSVALRRTIERWLVEHVEAFSIAAEVDDAAMLRVLGARGLGVFPVRDALKAEVEDLYDVQPLEAAPDLHERYYALSIERVVRDPGVAAIVDTARARLRA